MNIPDRQPYAVEKAQLAKLGGAAALIVIMTTLVLSSCGDPEPAKQPPPRIAPPSQTVTTPGDIPPASIAPTDYKAEVATYEGFQVFRSKDPFIQQVKKPPTSTTPSPVNGLPGSGATPGSTLPGQGLPGTQGLPGSTGGAGTGTGLPGTPGLPGSSSGTGLPASGATSGGAGAGTGLPGSGAAPGSPGSTAPGSGSQTGGTSGSGVTGGATPGVLGPGSPLGIPAAPPVTGGERSAYTLTLLAVTQTPSGLRVKLSLDDETFDDKAVEEIFTTRFGQIKILGIDPSGRISLLHADQRFTLYVGQKVTL